MTSFRNISIRDDELLHAGEALGKYQVLDVLNYSLLGGLYAVKDGDGKAFCLGVLPKRCCEDERFKKFLEQELPKLSGLDHPHVLKLLGCEEIAGRLCLLYEGYAAESLSDRIEALLGKKLNPQAPSVPPLLPEEGAAPSKKLKLKSAAPETKPKAQEPEAPLGALFDGPTVTALALQAVTALVYAHGEGVYHFGLIPGQWLIDAKQQLKIAAFGLEPLMGKDFFEQIVSQAVLPVKAGDKRFFISELDVFSAQRARNEYIDQREDIYALGLTLYFLLTGQAMNHEGTYVPVSACVKGLSAGWDILLQKCLSKDLAERYPTAQVLLEDLENLEGLVARYAAGEEVKQADSARPIQAAEEAPQPSAKPRLSQKLQRGLALGALFVVGLGLIFAFGFKSKKNLKPSASVIALVAPGKQPSLTLHVPAGAHVLFSGMTQPFEAKEGLLKFALDPGDYAFVVSAPNFRPKRNSISLTQAPMELTVSLDTDWGVLDLSTTPLAQVSIKDAKGALVFEGQATQDGRLLLENRLNKGQPYELSLKQENYEPMQLSGVIIPAEGTFSKVCRLEMSPGSLSVTTTPQGASIFIDAKEVGKSPVLVKDLEARRNVKVRADLKGYYSLEKTLMLSAGQNLPLDLGTLKARVGSALLSLFWDEGPWRPEYSKALTLQFDEGSPEPFKELHIPDLIEGQHSVVLRHPDCKPTGVRFMVRENESTDVIAKLSPYPATLKLVLEPAKPFTLHFGEFKLVPQADGSFSLRANQDYLLDLSVPGYYPEHQALNLKPKQESVWKVTLRSIIPPEKGKDYVLPEYTLALTWLHPGVFDMGSPRSEMERLPEEGPLTKVTLTYGFWMGTYEVTQAQYRQIMKDNPSHFKGDNRPVESLTHDEAVLFCQKLTQAEAAMGRVPEGYGYRLPTEAEWEYAARAGSSEAFSFGPTAKLHQGNFRGVYPDTPRMEENKAQPETTPVGAFSPNAFGLHDMHGNVSEWGLEAYKARLPGKSVQDPVGTLEGREYVVRGGNYSEWADRARSAARSGLFPAARFPHVGMRIVLGPVH